DLRRVGRLFRRAALAVLTLFLILALLSKLIGNPEGFPIEPMDGYSLLCSYLLSGLLLGGAVLAWCLKRYLVDAGVRARDVNVGLDLLFSWLSAGLLV